MDRIYAPWRSKYFSLLKDGGCLFCSIQREKNDEQVGILKRGSHWFVILNMFPYTSGHIMLVANSHIARFSDVSPAAGEEFLELMAACETAIDDAYHPEGLNIGANRGAVAGAGIVDHLHFHLCPRWKGDTNFMTAIAETRVVSEELEESYRKLAAFLK